MLDKARSLRRQRDVSASQLAALYMTRGELDKAEEHYRELVARTPFHPFMVPLMYKNLAWVQLARGEPDDALATMRNLIDKQPYTAENQLFLSAMLLASGRREEARAAAAESARIDPAYPRKAGEESRAFTLAADKLNSPVFATRALWEAAAACLADGDRDPMMLDTLAMAYASRGRFAEAADAARRGVAAAERGGDGDWTRALGERLKLYEAGEPYGRDSR